MSEAGRRAASLERKTRETEVQIEIDLDGTGEYGISTGIDLFDHMLESFAKHGLFDLRLAAKGDLGVDAHHTVEDVGITLKIRPQINEGDSFADDLEADSLGFEDLGFLSPAAENVRVASFEPSDALALAGQSHQ